MLNTRWLVAALLSAPLLFSCGTETASEESAASEQATQNCEAFVAKSEDFPAVEDAINVSGAELADWLKNRGEAYAPASVEAAAAAQEATVCELAAPNAAPPHPPLPDESQEPTQAVVLSAVVILGLDDEPTLDVIGPKSSVDAYMQDLRKSSQ